MPSCKKRAGRRQYRRPLGLPATLCVALLAAYLAGCTTPPPPTPTPTMPLPTVQPPVPTAQPTPETVRQQLILCTTEPRAASPFLPSQSGSDLLALFYEEPVERVGYEWEARLVERVPALETGDVITRTVKVTNGTRYADALGLVRQYTEVDPIELPKMIVTFTLKSDLLWSDGITITAKDAVLGYHLAQSPEAQGRWRALAERTARFVAVDELTLRWEGIPGYQNADYAGFLFPLQPAHRWQGHGLAGVMEDRTPPATGPFKIVAWESMREVRLVPNENYAGTQPALEQIIVRFPQQSPSQWDALLANGTCDVILPDPILLTSWDQWERLGAAGMAIVWADAAPAVLRIDVNLAPAGTPGGTPTTSPAQDLAVRQAISACLNRKQLTESLPAEAIAAAAGFIPPNHPAHAGTSRPAYAPAVSARLLDEAGWRDEDQDSIREAHDVTGFTDGEPLSMMLHFASQYFVIAVHVASDLEACGIDISLQPADARQLYTPGEAGPLFGRHFELALIGWQSAIPEVCGTWFSNRVPGTGNNWTGENFSGFASEPYDAACERALAAIDPVQQSEALRTAQTLLNEKLPTIFVAWRPFWFATRPDVVGIKPDASAYGTIWNIEDIAIATPTPQD
jgi:peptide/nickel transport system substrate-binding protein